MAGFQPTRLEKRFHYFPYPFISVDIVGRLLRLLKCLFCAPKCGVLLVLKQQLHRVSQVVVESLQLLPATTLLFYHFNCHIILDGNFLHSVQTLFASCCPTGWFVCVMTEYDIFDLCGG